MYLALIENEDTFHQRKFCAWKIILNRPQTFENVQQFIIMCVHACIHRSGGNIEYLMWTVTGSTIKGPHYKCQNLYCKCVMLVMSKILAIKIFIFKRKLSMNLKNHSYIVYSVYYFKVNNPCNTNKCISLPLRPTIFLYSFYILRRYYLAIFRELTPQFL